MITKRKTCKRKRIQQGGTIEYGAAAAPQRSKKARGGGDQERAQPTLRRSGNCGGTGHNMRTYKKDTKISSKSDTSTTCIGFLSDSNEIEEA